MPDTDTNKMLSDGEEVANLIASRGWAVIHPKLADRILDLQNINNIDTTDPASIPAQITARKMASDLAYAWLKEDVFGFVEQQDANRAAVAETADTGFVGRA